MGDKIKKFLTDNKGCPLTPAATKQLFVKFLEFLVDEGYGEELESLKNGYIKTGTYIVDDGDFIWVEDIPSNYSGHCIIIGDDGIMYLSTYTDGELTFELEFSSSGVSKVYPSVLVGLTHSFNELDQALQDLVNDAIAEAGNGVVCTQVQWNAIKELLDKSLYLNYNGNSMIKCTSDGLYTYVFGDIAVNYGYRIEIYYDITNTRLFMEYQEL